MVKSVYLGLLGVGIVSFVFGVLFGWKLRGARLNYIKKKRSFHSKKAEELQQQLNQ